MGILEQMRSGQDSTFMQVVMALLIVAFVALYIRPGGDRSQIVATVNGQKILDNVYKNISPDVTLLNCAFWVPTVASGKYCDENEFKDVKNDPAKVKSLLEDDMVATCRDLLSEARADRAAGRRGRRHPVRGRRGQRRGGGG